MFKFLATMATGLFATSALADMCYMVDDAYSPAQYRVMYYGGQDMAYNPYAVKAITITQTQHSQLTASLRTAAVANLALSYTETPDLENGWAFLGGYQNGSYIEMEIDGGYDEITIWHKFVTSDGEFHTHIAGDVRPCTSQEYTAAYSFSQLGSSQQGVLQQNFSQQRR